MTRLADHALKDLQGRKILVHDTQDSAGAFWWGKDRPREGETVILRDITGHFQMEAYAVDVESVQTQGLKGYWVRLRRSHRIQWRTPLNIYR